MPETALQDNFSILVDMLSMPVKTKSERAIMADSTSEELILVTEKLRSFNCAASVAENMLGSFCQILFTMLATESAKC